MTDAATDRLFLEPARNQLAHELRTRAAERFGATAECRVLGLWQADGECLTHYAIVTPA